MKLSVLILAASATTEEQQNKTEESKKQDKRGILVLGYVPGNFHNNNLGFSSIVLHNAAKVPFNTVTQQVPVHVPQPVPVPIRRPVPVPIPAPYTVNVPRPVPVPVPQAVPITVVRPVPVEVNRPVAIPVPHPVHVPVPQPYNVPVPHPIPVPDSSENQDSPGAEGDSGSNAEFGVKIIDSTKQTHDSLHNNAGSDDSANHNLASSQGRSGHEPGYTTIGTRSSPLSSEYGTGSAGREQGHINAGSPHQHQGHISSGSPHQDQGHTSHSSGEGDTFGYYTGIIVHGHPNKPASGSNIIGHDSGSSSQNAQGITSRLAHKIEHGYSGNSQADYKPEYQAVRNENNHSSGSALNTLESENIKNYQTASQSQITVQDARYDVGSYHSTQATEDTVSEAR
ncbi:hypothetical protein C0J52_17748 [Blattella germanica]|nr:hypothetical protein C0J52_17748 [Blattella germanica]